MQFVPDLQETRKQVCFYNDWLLVSCHHPPFVVISKREWLLHESGNQSKSKLSQWFCHKKHALSQDRYATRFRLIEKRIKSNLAKSLLLQPYQIVALFILSIVLWHWIDLIFSTFDSVSSLSLYLMPIGLSYFNEFSSRSVYSLFYATLVCSSRDQDWQLHGKDSNRGHIRCHYKLSFIKGDLNFQRFCLLGHEMLSRYMSSNLLVLGFSVLSCCCEVFSSVETEGNSR